MGKCDCRYNSHGDTCVKCGGSPFDDMGKQCACRAFFLRKNGDDSPINQVARVGGETKNMHTADACWVNPIELPEAKTRAWWSSEDDRFKASSAALVGAAEIATAMSAEQKSYRAGWEAGRADALRMIHTTLADTHRKVSARQQENADLTRQSRVLFDEMERIKAQHNAKPQSARHTSDRAATKAPLDKPYWAEGLDPDEP